MAIRNALVAVVIQIGSVRLGEVHQVAGDVLDGTHVVGIFLGICSVHGLIPCLRLVSLAAFLRSTTAAQKGVEVLIYLGDRTDGVLVL